MPRVRRFAMLAVASLVAAGCTGGSPAPTAPSGSPTPAPGVTALVVPSTALAPGRYEKTDFVPHLSFAVGRTGWVPTQTVTGFYDVERGSGLDVIAVQFARPTGASDTRQMIKTLNRMPGLVVRSLGRSRIGGLPATRVRVDNANHRLQAQSFAPVLSVGRRTLSVGSGRRLEIYAVDTPDGLLAVMVGGSIRHWQATVAVTTPLLRSIRFES